MKLLMAMLCLGLLTVSVQAADTPSTCTSNAMDKKLAGAAKTSFMTKCRLDTESRCNQAANDKRLSGAARTSFASKCISDGVGAEP